MKSTNEIDIIIYEIVSDIRNDIMINNNDSRPSFIEYDEFVSTFITPLDEISKLIPKNKESHEIIENITFFKEKLLSFGLSKIKINTNEARNLVRDIGMSSFIENIYIYYSSTIGNISNDYSGTYAITAKNFKEYEEINIVLNNIMNAFQPAGVNNHGATVNYNKFISSYIKPLNNLHDLLQKNPEKNVYLNNIKDFTEQLSFLAKDSKSKVAVSGILDYAEDIGLTVIIQDLCNTYNKALQTFNNSNFIEETNTNTNTVINLKPNKYKAILAKALKDMKVLKDKKDKKKSISGIDYYKSATSILRELLNDTYSKKSQIDNRKNSKKYKNKIKILNEIIDLITELLDKYKSNPKQKDLYKKSEDYKNIIENLKVKYNMLYKFRFTFRRIAKSKSNVNTEAKPGKKVLNQSKQRLSFVSSAAATTVVTQAEKSLSEEQLINSKIEPGLSSGRSSGNKIS